MKTLLILCVLFVSNFSMGDASLEDKSWEKHGKSLNIHEKLGIIHGGLGFQVGLGLIGQPNPDESKKAKNNGNGGKKGKGGPQPPKPGPNQPGPKPEEPPKPVPNEPAGAMVEMNFPGSWELALADAGVSAMHLQLLPNNKFVIYDSTNLGPSNIKYPNNRCIQTPNGVDCFAHAVEYDPEANKVRVLTVVSNPWCSSGGLSPDGYLVGTGGYADGERTIRYFDACNNNCDIREYPGALSDVRWYATHILLPDGRFVVFGGRAAWNYEFLAPEKQPSPGKIDFPFLKETCDLYENNLYPFINVMPDGNLFVFANNRSLLLDVMNNKVVRKYPDLPGGARNYPGSGCSTILPLNLRANNKDDFRDMEVIVCGGGQHEAFGKALHEKIFMPALDTCGRIRPMDPNPQWEIEQMPKRRVMSDMLNLPNGELLILNGAESGDAGWEFGKDAVKTPFLYTPNKPPGQRFKILAETQIARVYHSTSALLPDGRIVVAGSNTNPTYKFVNVEFPTELRIEKFSPPYLDPKLANLRPLLRMDKVPKQIAYNAWFDIQFDLKAPPPIKIEDIAVTMYLPPYTTHGYSMNQRLLNLPIMDLVPAGPTFNLKVQAPANNKLAMPCFYLLFVNYQGVPGVAAWVQLK